MTDDITPKLEQGAEKAALRALKATQPGKMTRRELMAAGGMMGAVVGLTGTVLTAPIPSYKPAPKTEEGEFEENAIKAAEQAASDSEKEGKPLSPREIIERYKASLVTEKETEKEAYEARAIAARNLVQEDRKERAVSVISKVAITTAAGAAAGAGAGNILARRIERSKQEKDAPSR